MKLKTRKSTTTASTETRPAAPDAAAQVNAAPAATEAAATATPDTATAPVPSLAAPAPAGTRASLSATSSTGGDCGASVCVTYPSPETAAATAGSTSGVSLQNASASPSHAPSAPVAARGCALAQAMVESSRLTADERLGLPSASGMERLHHCAGSWHMEQAHAASAEAAYAEETAASESGTRIHAALAGLAPLSTLSVAEEETYDLCRAQGRRVMQEWSPEGTGIPVLERRLGLTAEGTVLDVTPQTRAQARFIFTGRADLVIVEDAAALVIDYKTGRHAATVAQDNPQLAALAVLVALRHQVQRVRVAVVQPWAGPPTVADYGVNALTLARSWLLATLETAQQAEGARSLRCGAHCRHCRAQHACPAFQQQALREVERLRPLSVAVLPPQQQAAALWARALELTPQQHAAAYRGLELVERYVHAIRATFRQRVEAGHVPGWTLREKKGRRSIADVGAVFARCHAQGVSAEDFTSRCSIGLAEVKDALRRATGARGRALEELHTSCLGDAVTLGRPSFEVVPRESTAAELRAQAAAEAPVPLPLKLATAHTAGVGAEAGLAPEGSASKSPCQTVAASQKGGRA